MEHDSRGSGSESDLSDGWTVLNSFVDQDLPSQKGHAEASDEDSIESFDVEKLEIPIRDEESDGISVISESDICDPAEAILNIQHVPDREREHIEELQSYSGIPPVQHSVSRRRCRDSLSESDSCELPDSPVNLSLCPRRVRRQRFNSPPIAELDSCYYVDDFPALATGARIPSGNEACMRIYVHRPNDQINYLLTILLVLALAAVAGLGTGHFLGTKEILATPEEIVYKLRLENEILQNQLHKLLKEREVWRRLSPDYNTAKSEFSRKSDNMYLECSKSTSSVHCFPDIPSDFNHTFTSDQVPISVIYFSMGKSYPGWGTDFQNANSFSSNDELFSDRLEVNNLKVNAGKRNKIKKSVNDEHFSKTIPNYIPNRGNFISKEKDKNKVCFGKEAEKLAQDVKLALVHGLELSGKLEQALSSLDTALINMKNLKTKSASSMLDENGSLGKKALQGLKDILHDGDKSKALISKTVSKLYSMKSKLFKSYENFNSWKGKVLKEGTHSKPDGEHSPNVIHGPNLPSESYETSSYLYSNNPAHSVNLSGENCDSPNPSDIYGPHLPSSVNESPRALPNVLDDVGEVNVDISSNFVKNSLNNINIVNKNLDLLTPVHADVDDIVENSFSDAQSATEFELHPYLEPKQLVSEEVELKHETFPGIENFESVEDQSNANKMVKHGKMQQLNKNSKKQSKKQKNDLNEQYSHIVKPKESPRSNHDQKFYSDRKKKQKHKPQKFPGKGTKGEKFYKNDGQQWKYVQESKYKHKSKFQDDSEHKRDYKSFHKKYHDSKRHAVDKLYEKSVKSSKYPKNSEDHKRDYKHFHKKNQDSNQHMVDKLYEKSIKNAKNIKYKDSKHLFKHRKGDNIRHDQSAWSIDENGHRFTNTSGDWLMKLYKERARQREENQRSDWLFERATARKTKREEDRERARWYFQRARSRQVCRVDPTAEWCKTHDEDSNKFHRGEFWKRTHSSKRDNNDHDHDNFQYNQRDFKLKHAARHLRGTKYLSGAFRSVMNFLQA